MREGPAGRQVVAKEMVPEGRCCLRPDSGLARARRRQMKMRTFSPPVPPGLGAARYCRERGKGCVKGDRCVRTGVAGQAQKAGAIYESGFHFPVFRCWLPALPGVEIAKAPRLPACLPAPPLAPQFSPALFNPLFSPSPAGRRTCVGVGGRGEASDASDASEARSLRHVTLRPRQADRRQSWHRGKNGSETLI